MPSVKVRTLILHQGCVLVGKANGKWVVPGGPITEFEKMQDAAVRTFSESTGVDIKAEHILFVNEEILPESQVHNIVVYAYGQYVSGEIQDKGILTDLQWVDVRQLGQLQADMSTDTIDAFYKFSLVLRQQAAKAAPQQ